MTLASSFHQMPQTTWSADANARKYHIAQDTVKMLIAGYPFSIRINLTT